jgi:hypothetical protein
MIDLLHFRSVSDEQQRVTLMSSSALAPAGNSPVGLDPARLGSLDERSEATSLSLIPFESGRVELPLEREVLLMKCDLLRPWLMTMVEVAHG